MAVVQNGKSNIHRLAFLLIFVALIGVTLYGKPVSVIPASSSSGTVSLKPQKELPMMNFNPHWKSRSELGISNKKADGSRGALLTEPLSSQPDPNLKIVEDHYIYKRTTWDSAPIVLEKSKLVFFTVPKVGCSVFKQLFRRMMGLQIADDHNLSQEDRQKLHVDEHNPKLNGLKYLGDYPIEQAQKFLTDPGWTRAIFLRDPKERALSAYLDKGQRDHASYVFTHCCETKQCSDRASATFEGFLQVIHACNDSHWTPFIQRMEGRYWSTVNFVGRMESIQQDTRQLLQQLPGNLWEQYGATGWGRYRNESIFSSTGTVPHASGAKGKLHKYYTPVTEAMVEDMYQLDYKTKLFGFELVKLYS